MGKSEQVGRGLTVREAAQALLDRLDEIEARPHFRGTLTLGMLYDSARGEVRDLHAVIGGEA